MKNKLKIASVATTVLFSLAVLPGGIMNLVQPEILVAMSKTLGVPLALMSLVGVWKLLGVVALNVPQAGRLREWAYAGFFFDLTGAAYLHVAAADYAGVAAPLVLVTLLMASYVLRSKFATQGQSEGHEPAVGNLEASRA